jgi:glutamate dehydrogenase
MVIMAIQPLLTGPPIGGDRRLSGLAIKTDSLAMSSFPDYVDPFDPSEDTMPGSATAMSATSRLVEKIKGDDDPGRHPSPQPTHMSYPPMPKGNGNGHRILRSGTVGYVAPEFKGKQEQMKLGQLPHYTACYYLAVH